MTKPRKTDFNLADFPAQAQEKVRWSDTDAQGHVNNLIFASYCEAARIELMQNLGMFGPNRRFTIFVARLAIDFRAQLTWPGTVEIGTGIKAIGRTSITFFQTIFQNGVCAATADIVVVHVDATGTPSPIGEDVKQSLHKFLID